jgi:hypothetical protein
VRNGTFLVGFSEDTPLLDEQRGERIADECLLRIVYVFDGMVRDHIWIRDCIRVRDEPRRVAPGTTLRFKDDIPAVQAV